MRRRVGILLGGLAFLTMLTAGPVAATPAERSAPAAQVEQAADPITCAGYPQPRAALELQGWWQDRTGEAFPGRHIHIYVCWPTGVVTGTVGLDMRLQTHAQPAGSYWKRLRATDGSGSNVFPAMTSGFTKLDASGNMVQWVHKDINTSGLSSGLHEIRLAGYVRQTRGTASTSDDFDMLVSSGLPLFVRSMSGGATSRDYVEARGWYPGFEYTNSRYRNRLSDFLTAKSGIWTPTVQCASPSGANAKRMVSAIDANYHAGLPGLVVFDYPGETTKKLSINTANLTVGRHALSTRCEGGPYNLSGHDGTSTGVLVLPFTVTR